MTKEMKKANARLAEARAYVEEVMKKGAVRRSEGQKRAAHRIRVADRTLAEKSEHAPINPAKKEKVIDVSAFVGTMYSKIEIKKIEKGHFVVIADGAKLDKKFKSSTAAQEWCAIHTK